jgi:GNAT superfamily N-acetyltransferase
VSWKIRTATPLDAERVSFINRESLGYDCDVATTRERIAAILTRPTDRLLVAYRDEDGCVGGFILTADYETIHNGSQKNVLSLAVDERFQGLGLGRMLLDEAEAWARECGCTGVRLVSGFDRVKAHQFYRHCGYLMRKDEKNFVKSVR